MKLNINTLNETITEYEDFIKTLEGARVLLEGASSKLKELGWSGTAQKEWSKSFSAKMSSYKSFEDNVIKMKENLKSIRGKASSLKNRCEDFQNRILGYGTESYSEDCGSTGGILSLEYNNKSSIESICTKIATDLISKERYKLKSIRDTIAKHGVSFFSWGLKYSTINIDSEADMCFEEIGKENYKIINFKEAFQIYCEKIKELEDYTKNNLIIIDMAKDITRNYYSSRNEGKKHVSYIFYQPGVKSGDGKHLFDDEAKIEAEKYKQKYPGTEVILIPVKNPHEFKEQWGKMDDKSRVIDAVQIILHGSVNADNDNDDYSGAGFMYFDGEDYRTEYRIAADRTVIPDNQKKDDILISDLKNKKINELYFSSCNSANPDAQNVASEFNKIINSNHITGWDGGTIYNYNDEEPVKSEEVSGGYGRPEWRESKITLSGQHTWYEYVKKNLVVLPARFKKGKVKIK